MITHLLFCAIILARGCFVAPMYAMPLALNNLYYNTLFGLGPRRRANSSGQDSAVYVHLQASGLSFNDEDVHIREEC